MSVNALPFLDSSTASWDLALDRLLTPIVVEGLTANVVLFDGAYQAIAKFNDSQGFQGQFIQKAPDPSPAEEYTPGTEQVGDQYGFREDFISLDKMISQSAYFPINHLNVSHFEVIEPVISGKMQALARMLDFRGFVTLAKAARATSSVTDSQGSLTVHNGGNRITRSGASFVAAYSADSTGAANFRADADDLCLAMDNDFVPREGRVLFITPEVNRLLQRDVNIFDVRYAQDMSANNLQRAIVGEMAGFKVVMVAGRIPSTNINGAAVPTKYQGNFSIGGASTAGLPVALAVGGVGQGRAPVGYRQVGSIVTGREYDLKRHSWFWTAGIHCGFGQMHQYTAGSIEIVNGA